MQKMKRFIRKRDQRKLNSVSLPDTAHHKSACGWTCSQVYSHRNNRTDQRVNVREKKSESKQHFVLLTVDVKKPQFVFLQNG